VLVYVGIFIKNNQREVVGMLKKILGVLVIIVVLCIVVFVVKSRMDANAQFSRYEDYTMQTLSKFCALEPFDVKPEYRTIHPAKMLKLFKIDVSSYTADRLARINSLDATMFVFMKMFTLMIRPDYSYNLPMISVDFIFIGKKRVFVIEVIDPAKIDDDNKRKHYDRMRVWQDTIQQYEQSPTPNWSKEFVTDFSIHIKSDESQDDELFEIYRTFLEAYLDMAKNAKPLTGESRDKLRAGMETYVDTLLDKGGPAVDVFEKFLGPEKQREYVRTVMFGLDP
jgi:hypothetical protein